jgi:hypothetical protein
MSEPRLLTLSEAADQTGLTVDALRKRIKRGRLRSFRGNDGLVRVRLSDADMEELKADRPSSRPAGQLDEESAVVRALAAHNDTLREQLMKAEQRADRAEERAEKAEQRLIEELARLAGRNVAVSALDLNGVEQKELDALSAELDLESEGEGRGHPWQELPKPLQHIAPTPEPMEAEALSPALEASPEPESAAPVIPLVPESRRIWWSRFVPRRRRLT